MADSFDDDEEELLRTLQEIGEDSSMNAENLMDDTAIVASVMNEDLLDGNASDNSQHHLSLDRILTPTPIEDTAASSADGFLITEDFARQAVASLSPAPSPKSSKPTPPPSKASKKPISREFCDSSSTPSPDPEPGAPPSKPKAKKLTKKAGRARKSKSPIAVREIQQTVVASPLKSSKGKVPRNSTPTKSKSADSSSDAGVEDADEPVRKKKKNRQNQPISDAEASKSAVEAEDGADEREKSVTIDAEGAKEPKDDLHCDDCHILLSPIPDEVIALLEDADRDVAAVTDPGVEVADPVTADRQKEKRSRIYSEGGDDSDASGLERKKKKEENKRRLKEERREEKEKTRMLKKARAKESNQRPSASHQRTRQCAMCPITITGDCPLGDKAAYCSVACIEKHAERAKQVIDGDDTFVVVMNCVDGTMRTAPNAPRLSVLTQWLIDNPTFTPMLPKPAPKHNINRSEADSSTIDEPVETGRHRAQKQLDRIRQSIGKAVNDELVKRAHDYRSLFKLNAGQIRSYADALETAVFDSSHEVTNGRYKEWMRAFLTSTANKAGKTAVKRILSGEMDVRILASFTVDQLSDQRKLLAAMAIHRQTRVQVVQVEEETTLQAAEVEGDDSRLSAGDLPDSTCVDECEPSTSASTKVIFVNPTPRDTTAEHKSHFYDKHCQICLGRQVEEDKIATAKAVKMSAILEVEAKKDKAKLEAAIAASLSKIQPKQAADGESCDGFGADFMDDGFEVAAPTRPIDDGGGGSNDGFGGDDDGGDDGFGVATQPTGFSTGFGCPSVLGRGLLERSQLSNVVASDETDPTLVVRSTTTDPLGIADCKSDAVLTHTIVPPVVAGEDPSKPKKLTMAALRAKLLGAKKILSKVECKPATPPPCPRADESPAYATTMHQQMEPAHATTTQQKLEPTNETFDDDDPFGFGAESAAADAKDEVEQPADDRTSTSPQASPARSASPPGPFWQNDEFTGSQWHGIVSMPGYCCFAADLEFVYGAEQCAREVQGRLPTQFDVVGRIEPAAVMKYLLQLRTGLQTRQIIVYKMCCVEGVPSKDNKEMKHWKSFYKNMVRKSRYCVVRSRDKHIKDVYVMPLAAKAEVPDVFSDLPGVGLLAKRDKDMILCAVVLLRDAPIVSTRRIIVSKSPIATADGGDDDNMDVCDENDEPYEPGDQGRQSISQVMGTGYAQTTSYVQSRADMTPPRPTFAMLLPPPPPPPPMPDAEDGECSNDSTPHSNAVPPEVLLKQAAEMLFRNRPDFEKTLQTMHTECEVTNRMHLFYNVRDILVQIHTSSDVQPVGLRVDELGDSGNLSGEQVDMLYYAIDTRRDMEEYMRRAMAGRQEEGEEQMEMEANDEDDFYEEPAEEEEANYEEEEAPPTWTGQLHNMETDEDCPIDQQMESMDRPHLPRGGFHGAMRGGMHPGMMPYSRMPGRMPPPQSMSLNEHEMRYRMPMRMRPPMGMYGGPPMRGGMMMPPRPYGGDMRFRYDGPPRPMYGGPPRW